MDASDKCPAGAGSRTDTDGDGCKDGEDADDDEDGVADTADNCPLAANPGQADTDADRIGERAAPRTARDRHRRRRHGGGAGDGRGRPAAAPVATGTGGGTGPGTGGGTGTGTGGGGTAATTPKCVYRRSPSVRARQGAGQAQGGQVATREGDQGLQPRDQARPAIRLKVKAGTRLAAGAKVGAVFSRGPAPRA